MKTKQSLDTFNSMSVPQAVIRNAIPAMAAMLMTLIYNLADTFFIGQTNDPYQVAAVSLTSPVFMIFMAVGMVFGYWRYICNLKGYGRRQKRICKKSMCFLYVGMHCYRNYLFLPAFTLHGSSSAHHGGKFRNV